VRPTYEQIIAALQGRGRSRLEGSTTELVGLRANGQEFPIEMSMTRWTTSEGDFFGAIIRDVSDRKRKDLALAASEQAFRLLAENASDVVFRFTREGRLDWISESVKSQLGWTPAELLGRSPAEMIHPDDADPMVRAAPNAVLGQSTTFEAWFRSARGNFRWMSVVVKPITGPGGQLSALIGSARDVHAEVAFRQQLAASENRLRLVTDHVADVVILLREGRIAWSTPSLFHSLGGSENEWRNALLEARVHCDDLAQYRALLKGNTSGASAVGRLRLEAASGHFHWVECHFNNHRGRDGEPDGVVVSFRVVDEQVAAQKELERRARHDQLTGLLNSGEAMSRVTTLLSGTRRGGSEIGVLFCDADKFKEVNDTLGHSGGDEALRIIAERIRSATRATDIAARMGGDEFMVVLPSVQDLSAAVRVAEAIRSAVSQWMEVDGKSVRLSVSIGATLAAPGELLEAVMHRADEGMYQAKREGRDQVVAIPLKVTPDSAVLHNEP
jgi:diguanylate cyclase (GGDEF)-like protein/PAS domain S-box-containing protein